MPSLLQFLEHAFKSHSFFQLFQSLLNVIKYFNFQWSSQKITPYLQ